MIAEGKFYNLFICLLSYLLHYRFMNIVFALQVKSIPINTHSWLKPLSTGH